LKHYTYNFWKIEEAAVESGFLDALGGNRTHTPYGHMALNHACLPVPAQAQQSVL